MCISRVALGLEGERRSWTIFKLCFFPPSQANLSFALSFFFFFLNTLYREEATNSAGEQSPSLPLKGNNRALQWAGAPEGSGGWAWGGGGRKKRPGERLGDGEKEGVSKFKVQSLEISSSAYKIPTNLCYSA